MILRRLSRREQVAVFLAVTVVVATLLVQGVALPLMERREQLERKLAAKARTIQEMERLLEEYDRLRQTAALFQSRLASRPASFSLFPFMDRLAGQTGIKEGVKFMRPSSTPMEEGRAAISQVEIKIEGVDLTQLMGYLNGIEGSENLIRINRLSIARSENASGLIDALLMAETIELPAGAAPKAVEGADAEGPAALPAERPPAS
jgi:NhaP-type Na+/H+ or K+/H+ antiporter